MTDDAASIKRQSLATLITRIFLLVLGMITIGIFIQSYYFSNKIINQEVLRTKQQTSALVRNLFENHLVSLQIHHDNSAKSSAVFNFFSQKDSENLDFFFLSVDQADPSHTPEFRFLTDASGVIWDDGNGHFYGVNEVILAKIARRVAFNNNWHYLSMLTLMGPRHLLVRRSPVIDPNSGEVRGQFYVTMVLDNNFPLVEMLESGSNSDSILLLAEQNTIAHSMNGNETYDVDTVVELKDAADNAVMHDKLVSQTAIRINSSDTPLSILAVQDNSHVASLQRQHYLGIVFSILLMLMLSMAIRVWIQNRVANALSTLMNYSRFGAAGERFQRFLGSDIVEFDHIGHTLEDTFEQLESQRRSFQDLFNFALSPMMVWSENGLLIKMNPAARKELVVDSLDQPEMMHPVFHSFKQLLLPHVSMAGQGATLTGVNVPIGDKIFRWNLSPIMVEHGISGIIVQGQDITTLIEAERQSQLARREAEQSAKTRADFLAKMSHEIRTPLNGILGIAQLLKRSVQGEENLKQVDVLCHSGEHLLAVLNDILDFSKIEQGKFNIKKRQFSFADTLYTVENIYRPICRAKGVVLSIQSALPQTYQLCTDQVRLNQILFNLINNAVKFTTHGHIDVTFSLTSSEPTAQKLEIRVADTGIGIAQDKLESIFEPFVQAESITTREYDGSGLGLTIVKNLVEMLGGEIKVKSELGQGSEFCVLLPTSDSDHVEANSGVAVKPEKLFAQPLKVLLVEDNHTNAFILKAFCQKYRMQVEWVQDGTLALEKLASETFDLVIMDNQLPKMGGITATKLIREDLKLATPVYACTADTQEETKRAFLSAGANYVLVKPIKEEALYRAFVHFKQHFC